MASCSAASVLAQDITPMSCYWQIDNQNEVGTWESQLCTNPLDGNASDVLVTNKINIPSQNTCIVTWHDGYRTELKGTVKVVGDRSSCYGGYAAFQSSPSERLVDGVIERRLDCRWTNTDNEAHKLTCDDVQGRTLNTLIATKLQIAGSNSCMMNFNEHALALFEDGVAIVDKKPSPNACDVGPVYFRGYPKHRIVDGFQETLLQCSWRKVNDNMRLKYCSDVGELGKEVTVVFESNGQPLSLIDAVNRQLLNGEIREDKTLNAINPPIYYRAY
ncbi:hypothetical protein [Pseudoalteromonas luteoviolacea]|nr:hypothetical protein [Pseudoalteromonas luteoviolacea]